jgi:hypothetical protein
VWREINPEYIFFVEKSIPTQVSRFSRFKTFFWNEFVEAYAQLANRFFTSAAPFCLRVSVGLSLAFCAESGNESQAVMV